jgi:hypothetical protein
MTRANEVATLKIAKTPPTSLALESKAMLETFPPRRRRWLGWSALTIVEPPTDMLPALLGF